MEFPSLFPHPAACLNPASMSKCSFVFAYLAVFVVAFVPAFAFGPRNIWKDRRNYAEDRQDKANWSDKISQYRLTNLFFFGLRYETVSKCPNMLSSLPQRMKRCTAVISPSFDSLQRDNL